MHPAPVATHDSTPIELPAWATGDAEPDDTLHLIVYPIEEESFALFSIRAADRALTRLAIIAALALLSWMLIGLAVAHHAGRI
jgi:hypothetical protein